MRTFSVCRVVLATAGAVWTFASVVGVYPHNLSYFNEISGGPGKGHCHLLESNIAWGQDLLLLQERLDGHPDAEPFQLASLGWVDPRLAGIDFTLPPVGPKAAGVTQDEMLECGPQPGWYAVEVSFLHGTHLPAATGDGRRRNIATEEFGYEYFLRFEPVAMAGYSIYIYEITPSEANHVRRELGMRLLPIENRATE